MCSSRGSLVLLVPGLENWLDTARVLLSKVSYKQDSHSSDTQE